MALSFRRHIAIMLAVMMTVVFIPVTSLAASNQADDITYSTETGGELNFDRSDFNAVCKDLTGAKLDFVYFELPASSRGILYYDYDGSDEEKVNDSDEYYYSGSPSINDVSFIPKSGYSGTVTISYEGYSTDDDEFTGKIKITVSDSGGDAGDITYSVATNKTVDFDEDDFDGACQDANDEDLDYVKFTLPASSKGILYLGYDDGDYDEKISESTKYYYDKNPKIGNITFVPKKDYSGTVSISYKGYDTKGHSFTGTVKITVEESAGDIEYTVSTDKNLTFSEDDFNDFCEDENDETLDYVTFTPPVSSKGVLYYDYDGRHQAKVDKSDEYYYDDDPSIDDITFVPKKGFSGIVEIDFEGEDMAGDSIDGTVVITVKGTPLTADTINYTVSSGSSVYFKETDFNAVTKKLKNNDLDYVKFTLPSASSGKLYYGYTSAGNYTSTVSATTKYYYSGQPFLLNVVFVPAANSSGVTTINYTGYDTEGNEFTGKVQITAGTATLPGNTTLKKSKYFGDVDEAYSWAVDYIDTMYQDGIITGSTGTDGKKHFYPAAKIKRGEFMVLLYRALSLKASGTVTGNFSDVAKGEYYYDAIAVAKALEIAQGSDNKFYPNSSITREDTMVLALRAMNKSGSSIAAGNDSTLSAYTDQNVISSYAREPIAALIKAGIITGSDDHKIHPMESITRAEAAAIIYRIKY